VKRQTFRAGETARVYDVVSVQRAVYAGRCGTVIAVTFGSMGMMLTVEPFFGASFETFDVLASDVAVHDNETSGAV